MFRRHKQLCGAQQEYLKQVLPRSTILGLLRSLSHVPSPSETHSVSHCSACRISRYVRAPKNLSGSVSKLAHHTRLSHALQGRGRAKGGAYHTVGLV